MEDFAAIFAERGYLAIDRLFDPALIAAIHDENKRQFGSLDDLPPHLKVGDRRVQVPIGLTGRLLDPMLFRRIAAKDELGMTEAELLAS